MLRPWSASQSLSIKVIGHFTSAPPEIRWVTLPTGKSTKLTELLALQSEALVVVASSTGPLHTATALGTAGIGLYGPDAPEWAARWAPIGPNATALTASGRTSDGHLDIPVREVREAVLRLVAKRKA